jgi:4-hydroxy-tetrahydrodipicolinate reductase
MLKLILVGCNGYMGRVVTDIIAGDPSVSIIAGVDIDTKKQNIYPVYTSPGNIIEKADVLLDFSNPSALTGLLKLLCTTGYSTEQIPEIEKASGQIPVFRSGNMSLGINLLADLIKRASSVLGEDYDIEIVERHHRRKVDAPSGTAILLADAAAEAMPGNPEYIYERESKRKPRSQNEIGISAVRGGTIVGVHDVIFAGEDEVIELRHTASSRNLFASGAIKAAKYMQSKQPGMYTMTDVLG